MQPPDKPGKFSSAGERWEMRRFGRRASITASYHNVSWTQRGQGLRMSSFAGKAANVGSIRLVQGIPGPHQLTGDSACLPIRDHRLLPLPAPMWRDGATPGQSRAALFEV